jgi:hypothetical protein
MSYCRLNNGPPSKWLEPYRWTSLLEVLRAPLGPGLASSDFEGGSLDIEGGDVVQVRATVPRTGSDGSLDPVVRVPRAATTPSANEGDANVLVQVLDRYGSPVGEHRAALMFVDAESGAQLDSQRVSATIEVPPVPLGGVRVFRDGVLVAERVASSHPPSVRIVSPNGGESLGSGEFTMRIDAHDEDGDPITWSVLQSPDGGETWLPLVLEATGSETTVDPSVGPGGTHAMLRVVATDGMNTVIDDTDAEFSLPATPPTATILAPERGSHLAPDVAVTLQASATSAAGASLNGRLQTVWLLDGEPIAAGQPAVAAFPSGTHELRLRVRDDQTDAVAEDAMTIYVDGTCAETGAGDPTTSETGVVSGTIKSLVAPLPTVLSQPVRAVNCGIVVPVGL